MLPRSKPATASTVPDEPPSEIPQRSIDMPIFVPSEEMVPDYLVQQLTDPGFYQKLNTARSKLFLKWAAQPNKKALLQCYLMVRCNSDIRHLLMFIFSYEGSSGSPPSPAEMNL
jgi:hypothetical protein